MDDPNEEYLLWQTLVGAWPIGPTRLELYLEKAMREGKRTTTWTEPDERHERRAKQFVHDLYENHAFLDDLEPFVAGVKAAGEHASLGALLLELTAPGVPDIYQGDELWSFNLVDPDNRRPVDWPTRHRTRGAGTVARDDETAPIRRVLRLAPSAPKPSPAPTSRSTSARTRVGFVRGGLIRVVVPLRPGDRVSANDDLLPEYAQALTLIS